MTFQSKKLPFVLSFLLMTFGATPAIAQMDGLVAHPAVYRLQFENDWVRLVRVTVPGNTTVAAHTHPPGWMIHLYLNDAQPIVFDHDGPPHTRTRPPVKARSYRIGRAKPETHAIVNLHPGTTDFMRIEFKAPSTRNLGQRLPAPPLVNENSSIEEVATDLFKATRVTVAAQQATELSAGANHPVLLIALTDGVVVGDGPALRIGQERFIDPGEKVSIRNARDGPIQVLKVDILLKSTSR